MNVSCFHACFHTLSKNFAPARTMASFAGAWLFVWVLASGVVARAQTAPRFDFTQPAAASEWTALHDVERLIPTAEGLQIAISGLDPYVVGPARDYPANTPLWMHIRLKSQQAGNGQVFYFPTSSGPTEANSVRFPVRGERWEELDIPLPPLGVGYKLRFDPPGSGGTCLLASLAFTPRVLLQPPIWPRPALPVLGSDVVSIQSGLLQLVQAHHQPGGFVVKVGDQIIASGYTRPQIGYIAPNSNNALRWVDVVSMATTAATKDGEEIVVRSTLRDPDGATWSLHRAFRPLSSGAIRVLTTIQADQDRDVVFLPMFLLLSGGREEGGGRRYENNPASTLLPPSSLPPAQALFAGLEYLDRNEASSSELDIRGPGSRRQTPDTAKLTFPLMALTNGTNYIGLMWDKPEEYTALFDSPDRIFGSGGQVMGILWPGSDGANREEGNVLPYKPRRLVANKPLVLNATIVGGRGRDVTAAVQQYVELRGLPALPKPGYKWADYANLAVAGFLNSAITDGDRYRHAVPSFGSQPAADVAVMLDYLATQTNDRAQQTHLRERARASRAQVAEQELSFSGIGHVRTPVGALVYGGVEVNAARLRQYGEGLLARFDANNSVRYQPPASGSNLASTHFAPDANGLTAQVVVEILQAGVFSGNRRLIAAGLEKLHGLDRFAGMVPRGAQTWEVPLHTPDILASAHLVRAYTLGYEITGDPLLLAQAKYWAWTGVSFVYLWNPTGQGVGPYATIAVYGATQWVAPNWMGLPVQWCGLVYADALYRFLKYDPAGPWKQIADGITVSGIQQTWPRGLDMTRQGLLPDSFALRPQLRNDPAINPGTLLTEAARYYERPALYDFRVFRSAGVFVHAPGEIDNARENGQALKDAPDPNTLKSAAVHTVELQGTATAKKISFVAHGWTNEPYYVLISGLKTTPVVRVNRQEVSLSAPNQFSSETGRLVLQVRGAAHVEIGL